MQLGLIVELQRADQLLHFRRFLPVADIRLVAADVDVPAREQVQDLGQYLLHKGDRPRARGQNPLVGGPALFRGQVLQPLRIQAEFGIGDNRGPRVGGHFDLGHDRDMPRGGVADQVTDVPLSVKPARPASLGLAVLAQRSEVHPGADPGEIRILPDLDPPALVVGEMDLQAIELMQGHDVDELLNIPYGDEMAGGIDQQAPPRETRVIRDADAGHRPSHAVDRFLAEYGRRQQLPERLDPVEQPGRRRGPQGNGVGPRLQLIALGAQPLLQGGLNLQLYRILPRRVCRHLEPVPERGRQ
jgi:hypothetical protein